jgi:hypothetical protein
MNSRDPRVSVRIRRIGCTIIEATSVDRGEPYGVEVCMETENESEFVAEPGTMRSRTFD